MKLSYIIPLYIFSIFFQFRTIEKSRSSESNAALILLLTEPKIVKSSNVEDLVTTTSSGGIFTSIVNATSPTDWTYCTTNPTYGYKLVYPHTNVNLRISQKLNSHFHWFVGVENLLDAWEIQYNLQRPRFFYLGLDG